MIVEKQNKRKKIYRRCLYAALAVSVLVFLLTGYFYLYEKIPGDIKLKAGVEHTLDLKVPLNGEIVKVSGEDNAAVAVSGQNESNIPAQAIYIDLSGAVTMKADALDSYRMDLKLFGIIPFKQVDIQVIQDKVVTPVGMPIGIYLKTNGVLVIGVGDFDGPDGVNYSPVKYVLKSGDYILKVNGVDVTGKEEFIETVEQGDGSEMTLTVRRNDEIFDVGVVPELNQAGEYKLGLWIRDNAQGVGTMTFVDDQGNFGALGHGINDVDTSTLMNLQSGTLYHTDIISIKKGTNGSPGEMTGMIDYADSNILGTITANTTHGIFGVCNDKGMSQIQGTPIPIGLKQDIVIGSAQILCSVDGKVKYYDVEISELRPDHNNVNRGIVLKITDPALLAVTGGIVQGMSGAPIIQNGKLVGAVTHVLVQDSTKGYGIFIENMLGTSN